MNERTWQRVKEIFHEAAARPADERLAYVRSACGDDHALRAEVEDLLAAHDEADRGSSDASITRSPEGEVAGTLIGPYKLLQRIGEGGFGIVYMAEQTEPVRRLVALKIIKLGMDTKQVIARFEAERQALALMDHPNIARVLDAGATATGRPYFVMELVKGVPITDYCDSNQLSTRQRLELFIDVCHAVRHAHQKGVIHRDLKPSNVMVTLHDGTPVPKVIDFGIAKATSARLTDKTLFTEFRQFMGTPEYMSPEQAEMSGLDVDTRADIYALGVLLYELLTGTTPLDAKTLRRAAYDEILRAIREVEPQRPSTRVSALGERLSEVARHRRAEPNVLSRLLLGDLDWIVMKALEKDRTRRYDSADGFAQDIERHLRDEPVLASPPSAVYKLRKFARRNHRSIVALSAVAAALVFGLATATWGWLRALEERDIALVARQDAKRETERVEKVNSILRRFLHAPSSRSYALAGGRSAAFRPDVKVVDVLDEVAESLDTEFADEPEIEADVRLAIGQSYLDLSRYPEAENQLRRVLELRQQISGGDDMPTMRALALLGEALNWQGRFEESEASFRRGIDGCRRLVGERAEETLDAQAELVNFLMDKGDPEAESLARRILELSRERRGPEALGTLRAQAALAYHLCSAGKPAEGERLATETLAAFRRISADENERTVCLFVLGNAALALHRPADAETHYREVIDRAARNGDSDLIVGSLATAQLAIALGEQGRWAEAETCQRQASAAYLRLLGGAHPFTLMAANNLAWNLHHQGRDAEAEPIARSAVEGCRRSPEIQPSAMIAVLDTLACVCTGLGRAEQAEALFIEIEALEKRLSRPQLIPQVMLNHAETLIRLGKLDDAERRFLAARDLLGESDDTVRDVAGRLAQLKAATEAKQGPVQSNSGEEK